MYSTLEERGDTSLLQNPFLWSFRNPKVCKRSVLASIYQIYLYFLFYHCCFLLNMNCNSIPRDNELHSQISSLVNIGRKAVRCTTQLDFLKNSLAQNSLPNGIAKQMKFTPSILDETLKHYCNLIMHDAASRILDVMVNYYHGRQEVLRASHYSHVNALKNKTSQEQFNQAMDTVIRSYIKNGKNVSKGTQSSYLGMII